MDNDNPAPPYNVIDDAAMFVQQQYHDFLNREPDAGGLAYWSEQIRQCGSDVGCINSRRVGVSAAFFVEQEFQQTGFYIYLVRKAVTGSQPDYDSFMHDRAYSTLDISDGIQTREDSRSGSTCSITASRAISGQWYVALSRRRNIRTALVPVFRTQTQSAPRLDRS